MYNHNKAQQSKNRVHISWDILYHIAGPRVGKMGCFLILNLKIYFFYTVKPVWNDHLYNKVCYLWLIQ